jgi:predicted transcriptional regulator
MIDDELRDLRRELARIERGRGLWYPDALRERAAAWARARREVGATWREISATVGLPAETLRRWTSAAARDARPALVPIEIVREPEAEDHGVADRDVRIMTPGGLRIEGLTTADAIAIVRVLG